MLVRKYGGSSVASQAQIERIVASLPQPPLVVVLSAPKGRTDALYRNTQAYIDSEIKNHYIASGELESCYLLQMALAKQGRESEIVTYKNLGIYASQMHGGHIHQCNPLYIQSVLATGKTVIVPGFQAIYENKLALLKRGGSDDTAVALAIEMNAKCEIYSDVEGIYQDVGQTYQQVSYQTLLGLIGADEAPMSRSAVLMAQANQLSICFNHWDEIGNGTEICTKDQLY